MISKNKIKAIKSLHLKKYRDKEDRFIIEGKKIVEEVLQYSPDIVEEIYCTASYLSDSNIENNFITELLSDTELKKISSLTSPQSILAIVNKNFEVHQAQNDNNLVLALDSVRDPGNLGTIIRMADWFGIGEILCSPDCVDCFNPKVVQATMGAIFRVTIKYGNMIELLEMYKIKGYDIYGATLEGENLYQEKLNSKSVIVMGNESSGISQKTKAALTKEIRIPNYSKKAAKTESLNVSIATSVILSEFCRQNTYSK